MSGGILVVTLNPALDVTHELARVDWAGVNRPDEVRARPGGKGINVARTLHALGTEVLAVGLAGGRTGAAVRVAAAAAGLRTDFTKISGETRRTFAVVDRERGHTALFNEPGPLVTAVEYGSFLARYRAGLIGAGAVVLTGSLPRGLPAGCYAELAGLATAAGVPVVLDTEGPPLLDGLAARPAVIKPNLTELAGATSLLLAESRRPGAEGLRPGAEDGAPRTEGGIPRTEGGAPRAEGGGPDLDAVVAASDGGTPRAEGGTSRAEAGTSRAEGGTPRTEEGTPRAEGGGPDLDGVVAAADELRAGGAQAVVVSLGEHGLLAVTGEGTWRAWPRVVARGNATGAGDAVVAGLARGLAEGRPWPGRLREAAALGAATAAAPVAGEFSRDAYERALATIEVSRLEAG